MFESSSSSRRARSFSERRARVGGDRRFVVRALWPLLALMFCGVWLAWPWALFNEWLLDSDEFRSQVKTVVVGLLGATGLAAVVLALHDAEVFGLREARYAYVVLTAWKLGVSYWLTQRQSPSYRLYEYFGGKPINGAYVFIVGIFLAPTVLGLLPNDSLLELVLR